ncbi:hypothetical protein QUF80_01570 [Desulfococcaceae bacterium HSG8]|nr:hypothetical protein [Desulfococcaceae bacterium HSG8]
MFNPGNSLILQKFPLCLLVRFGIIFLFLSVDEGFQIHESIGDIVENYICATKFLYFPWVVPTDKLLYKSQTLKYQFVKNSHGGKQWITGLY